jgi:hypothetical protein
MKNSKPLTRRLVRTLAAPAAAGLIALSAGASPALASTTPCSSSNIASYVADNSPPACWRPYASNSPFNTPIPSNPTLAPSSGSEISQMDSHSYHFDGSSNQYQFESDGSRAVYFANNSDPLVTINCTAYWGPNTCQGWNGIPINNIQIHIPAGAQPESDWDHHMIVVDTTTGTEYDFERASWTSSNELTVWSGSAMPIGGNGLDGGADAADLGLLAGTITAAQLASGTIDHALAVSVPCTTGYVWPATGAFGQACSAVNQNSAQAIPMGALLQLNMTPAQIAATHAPAWQQTIMRAMATYGMYANDTNGTSDTSTLEVEKWDDISYTSVGQAPQMANLLKSLGGQSDGNGGFAVDGVPIPVSKLRVIAPCVQQGTCPSSPAPTTGGGKGPKNPDPIAQTARTHEKTLSGTSHFVLVDAPRHAVRRPAHRKARHHRRHRRHARRQHKS